MHMKQSFDELFKQMPFLPESLYTDRGNEFESNEMKDYFEATGVQKFAAKSSKIKAAVAERAIRTLKNRFAFMIAINLSLSDCTSTFLRRTPRIGFLFCPNSCMQSTTVLAGPRG